MQTICLNMIVKNEAHIIVKTLENLTKYISFSLYVICDTGSTDNTQTLIKEFFDSKGIPGEIHQCEWKDFGHNRTEALEKAYNKSDYLLIFDADDFIDGDFKLPEQLTYDAYKLHMSVSKVIFNRILLINNRKQFKFLGVLHECLDYPNHYTTSCITGNYKIMAGTIGCRSKNSNKYNDDANILLQAYEEEKDNKLKSRYAFYCAQSFRDAGDIGSSITWYKKCLEEGSLNWSQEKYCASLTIGNLYSNINKKDKAIHYWLKTMDYDIERADGVSLAADEYTKQKLWNMSVILYDTIKNTYKSGTNCQLIHNKMFLDTKSFDYLKYQVGISAFYSYKPHIGFEVCKDILLNNVLDRRLILQTLRNLKFYLKFYSDVNLIELFYAVHNIIGTVDTIESSFSECWLFLFNKKKDILSKDASVMEMHSKIIK